MIYRTQQAVQSLFDQVKEEPINELLHLESYANIGWSEYEIKRCIALFRTLLSTPNCSIQDLVALDFSYSWVQEILALLNITLPSGHDKLNNLTSNDNVSMAMLFLSQQGYLIKRINKRTGKVWASKHDKQFQFELRSMKYKKQNTLILLGLS
ncbi:hypothetical protein AB4304_18400 [Vibrio breoganii]